MGVGRRGCERSSAIRCLTSAPGTIRVVKMPAGKPVTRNVSSMSRAHRVTLLACLRTPALPAIRAGAAKRKTCQ